MYGYKVLLLGEWTRIISDQNARGGWLEEGRKEGREEVLLTLHPRNHKLMNFQGKQPQ